MKKPIKKAPRSGNREASRRVQDRKKKQSTSKGKLQEKKSKVKKPPKASGKTAAQKRAELETRKRRARAARLGWKRKRAREAKQREEAERTEREEEAQWRAEQENERKEAERLAKKEELQAQRRLQLEIWREEYHERLERERFDKDLRESEREWKRSLRAALDHAEKLLGSSPHLDLHNVKRRLKEQGFPFLKRYLTYSANQLLAFASNPIRDGEINPFWYH